MGFLWAINRKIKSHFNILLIGNIIFTKINLTSVRRIRPNLEDRPDFVRRIYELAVSLKDNRHIEKQRTNNNDDCFFSLGKHDLLLGRKAWIFSFSCIHNFGRGLCETFGWTL